jgi:hypothetical protein
MRQTGFVSANFLMGESKTNERRRLTRRNIFRAIACIGYAAGVLSAMA